MGYSTMCEFLDKVENRGVEKGRAEGRKEERVISIKALMDNLQILFEEATRLLNIPDPEKERY